MAKARSSTLARARAFLAAFRQTCNITGSAKAARISPRQHYRWLEKYPKYAAAFKRATVIAAGHLESVAIERATTGWKEPVYYQGKRCGTVRRFDGGLMHTLLRAWLPDKYKNTTEVTGANGAPIEAKLEIVFVGSKTGAKDADLPQS